MIKLLKLWVRSRTVSLSDPTSQECILVPVGGVFERTVASTCDTLITALKSGVTPSSEVLTPLKHLADLCQADSRRTDEVLCALGIVRNAAHAIPSLISRSKRATLRSRLGIDVTRRDGDGAVAEFDDSGDALVMRGMQTAAERGVSSDVTATSVTPFVPMVATDDSDDETTSMSTLHEPLCVTQAMLTSALDTVSQLMRCHSDVITIKSKTS